MRPVPIEAGLARQRRRLRGAAAGAVAAAVLTAALVLAGLWPPRAHELVREAPAPAVVAPAVPFDGTLSGAPLQRARCLHWKRAGLAERRGALAGLAMVVGGASTSGGVGTTLPEAQAMALMDRTCATPATRNFVLYIIYARAAAFSRS
jgi:hypothetical protein